MAFGMRLESKGNATQEAPGIPHLAKYKVCDDLRTQTAQEGQPWDRLCVYSKSTGELLRVLSPGGYISTNATSFSDYWTSYTTAIAQHLAANPLIINTRTDSSLVNCTFHTNSSSTSMFTCEGDNRDYPTPTTGDIFACNTGPFVIREATTPSTEQSCLVSAPPTTAVLSS